MSTKQKIQNIKTNIERTIQGLTTAPREFTYKESGGFVRNNMTYSIYYTLSKDEIYLTGTTDSKNSQIRYTEFQWRISGKREEVTRDNQRTINDLELEYNGISKKLFPLQLWKPTKDTAEDVQKKLLFLKTN